MFLITWHQFIDYFQVLILVSGDGFPFIICVYIGPYTDLLPFCQSNRIEELIMINSKKQNSLEHEIVIV